MKKWVGWILIVGCFYMSGGSGPVHAEDLPREEEPIIQPPVEEKKVKEAKIDTERLEVGPFYGLYAPDGFGASGVLGIRLAYHLTEDVFFEGSFGMTQIDQTAFRRVIGRPLAADEDVTYWSVDVGYNLFPGQVFLTRKRTINSTIYLIGGLGQTRLDRRDHFTFNLGTGFKLFVTDWLDIRTDLRAHAFETDLTGQKERNYNLEGTVALAAFF
jgi:outer membrane beta-barrel protein